MSLPVYLISLSDDVSRRAPLLEQLEGAPGFDLQIVYGVSGQLLPYAVRSCLVGDATWAKNSGTIGCFLSHVSAWEKVACSPSPFCLVVEDDTEISCLQALRTVHLPEGADVLFVNGRYAPDGQPSDGFIQHRDMLKLIEQRHCGLGNEGYLLTPAAARKMLKACVADGFYGHVDGRMLRYCSSDEDIASLPGDSKLRHVLSRHHHPTRETSRGVCKAFAAGRALILHRGEKSVREAFDASTSA